ncbi:S-adenosyl-L-methionine-dependent methyltransferase [Podospora didyma]|uniref:S-adenosyl-L-methionine-dependent methyltransferase n=1 Tax=Podospora didyma TaxID=330526 RepID=A0AAE0K579_9PEZI|nr:S-adenosyl-L-methionine-dependent methyltransferase [Podospora didyma]
MIAEQGIKEEQDRLDFQHRVMSMILKNRLAWAPIQDPRNVLDIATGTGIWTIEFAKQHPTAQVTGTDLSSIQPKHGLPPNVNFITREDAEDEWLFPGLEPFDYVHLRLVSTCFNNPRTVIRQAFSHLLPGGWIEFQDSTLELAGMDTTPLHDTSPLARFFQTCIRGAAKMGRDVCVTKHYRNWLVEAGFVEVVEREMPPGFLSNRWTLENEEYQEIGRYSHANLSRWIDNAGRYLKLAGLSKEQIVELQKRAQEDLRDRGVRAYFPVHVVYGRKPYEWEVRNLGKQPEVRVKTESYY